jgi:hypothetical protein
LVKSKNGLCEKESCQNATVTLKLSSIRVLAQLLDKKEYQETLMEDYATKVTVLEQKSNEYGHRLEGLKVSFFSLTHRIIQKQP